VSPNICRRRPGTVKLLLQGRYLNFGLCGKDVGAQFSKAIIVADERWQWVQPPSYARQKVILDEPATIVLETIGAHTEQLNVDRTNPHLIPDIGRRNHSVRARH